MRAVVFHDSGWRQALAFVAGQLSRRAFVSRLGPVRLAEVPEPALRGPQWALVDTRLCGICGSDTKQVFLEGRPDNPLTAIISFPMVLGHEAVGVVSQAGPDSGVAPGTRVALCASLGCEVRGTVPPCRFCAVGQPSLCERLTAGPLAPAIHIGNSRDLPGGFSERFTGHRTQLFAIPEHVGDEQAMVSDTVSVALQPLLRHPPRPDRPVVVYGMGSIGLCAVALLRALHPRAEVWAIARYPHQARLATRLGASRVLASEPRQLIEQVAALDGSPVRKPWFGLPWLERGAGTVYDTISSAETLEVSTRIADKRAVLVQLGVAIPRRFEWTMLYFKELELKGSNAFGWLDWEGQRQHCYHIYFTLLARGLDVSGLVTHRFPLPRWRDALLCARERSAHQAIKVALGPGAATPTSP
jgi:threonine dehydrogenase-like Zn-dependent dehydrogenase